MREVHERVPHNQTAMPGTSVPASRTALAVSQLYYRVIRRDGVGGSSLSIPLTGESSSCPKVVFGDSMNKTPGLTHASPARSKELGFCKVLPNLHL